MTAISYRSQYIINKPRASFAEICLVGVIGFFGAVGSGSSTKQRDVFEHAAYVIPVDTKKEESNSVETTTHLTISEQVELIKKSFGLNISAMAELLNVSRPTVYAWLKGEPPKTQENISHINFVENQARMYGELNLVRPDNFIKRPLFDGESLFSLLKQKKTISSADFILIQGLDYKESQTRVVGLKKNEFRTSDDVLDDFT